jgi:hypothetical protein
LHSCDHGCRINRSRVWLLAIGTGGLDLEADDQALLPRGTFVYDALYAWCARQAAAPAGQHT